MKFLLFILSLVIFEGVAQRVKPTAPLTLNPKAVNTFGGSDTNTKVVFIRPYKLANALMNCAVHVNDQKLVALKNNTYFSFPIQSTTYLLSWKGKSKRSIQLDVNTGETYYVVFEMTGRINVATHGTVTLDFTPRLVDKMEAEKWLEEAEPIH